MSAHQQKRSTRSKCRFGLGHLFCTSKLRNPFHNRSLSSLESSSTQRKEKKPLVSQSEKKVPLLESNNDRKNTIDPKSQNNFFHSLESASDESSESSSSSRSTTADIAIEKEMQEVFNLAVPWTVLSIISYCADFAVVLIISHYMGNAAMIVYSTVWFILDFFNILSGGIYGSCYKHVNNSIADENYNLAGEYLQISIIINMLISVPACIAAVLCMESIMGYYGYNDEVIDMTLSYAVVAALDYVMEGNLDILGTVLDIDGHAKFNAVYGLWESLINIALTITVIVQFRPTLFVLAIYHFAQGLIMNAMYCYIVYYRYGWLNKYLDGIISHSAIQNTEAIYSLIMRSLPLLLDDCVQSVEWFVLSLFAAYQGAAEAVVWILLAYIWAIIEVIPEAYAEAVASRVAHNLSAGNVEIAGYIASQALLYGTLISVALSIPLLIFRRFIVWCISVDEVLEDMLIAVLPYIALCQPFIALGSIATSLNESLCLYHHAVKIMLLSTCLITLPVSALLTYHFGYNIESLAAGVCMGYATGGLWNFHMYLNADWTRAVRKNQEVTKFGEKSISS